jgi:hypothetical protein
LDLIQKRSKIETANTAYKHQWNIYF